MKKNNKMVVDAMVNAIEEGDAYDGANDSLKFVRWFVKDIDFSKVKIIVREWKSLDACVCGDEDDMSEKVVDVNGLCSYLNEKEGKIVVDEDGWNKDEDEVEISFIAM